MAYCKKCGAFINDNASRCPQCGTQQNAPIPVNDKGGFGWGALGFFVPVVGLILFFVWKETKPKSSKAAGMGALISVIANVVLYLLCFIIALISSTAGYY